MKGDKFTHYPLKKPSICAGSILLKEDKIILIKNNKTNEIVLPKGHVDEGDTIVQTAIKETYEETGYKCKIKGGPFCMTFRENETNQKIIFWYITKAIGEHELNTQMVGEDFTSLEIDLCNAKEMLTFDSDKKVFENYVSNLF
ncbi:hypothetical protein H311_00607 [Anncaliia algerae PRA109]|nr:hypothetical protein H311_00607 [Anncaliia algerae PRA109]